MKNVYVMIHKERDDSDSVGVFKSLEKAKKELAKYIKMHRGNWEKDFSDQRYINEFEDVIELVEHVLE